MTIAKLDLQPPPLHDDFFYNELIRSIPEVEKHRVLKDLEAAEIAERTEKLQFELTTLQRVGLQIHESRVVMLAALRGVKFKQISPEQLATLHLLDSAIRTLYTNPMAYLIFKYVNADKELVVTNNMFLLETLKGLPNSVHHFHYGSHILPNPDTNITDLPQRMQKQLVRRFFNLTSFEWKVFCHIMNLAIKSEQYYHILKAPEEGCWSSIFFRIQKILKCMRVLDVMNDSNDGQEFENIMVVPSFTMFQAALTAKAHTLNRNPVQLIPTYGYIDAEHYAELKTTGKIAIALYLPETKISKRYQLEGSFRTDIDGHPAETAFSGAIHDVYHAMREMSMFENVANARMRLAAIAKNHPKNKSKPNSRAVDDILIDGELIFSYPPEIDTMFETEYRPLHAQKFGEIFYILHLKKFLHPELKQAFIEDMVLNKTVWEKEFRLNRDDLLKDDQQIYDEIQHRINPQQLINTNASLQGNSNHVLALSNYGLFAVGAVLTVGTGYAVYHAMNKK